MSTVPVDYVNVSSTSEFLRVIEMSRPVVIKRVDVGPCLEKWTGDYLKEKLPKREVVVHSSLESKMSFLEKNFEYKAMNFADFVDKASDLKAKEVLYLRSIAGERYLKCPASIWQDFPEIADDFILPKFFHFKRQPSYPPSIYDGLLFSTVLRIASRNFNLWTHFDSMDNLLICLRGRKKIVLFPPEDITKLYMVGDKSLVKDLDDPNNKELFPLFLTAERHEIVLEEGEALFIPALWFHNVTSLDFNISVNIFWKDHHVSPSHYDSNDIYGNRPLIPASNAIKSVKKAIASLKCLPIKYTKFYLEILREEVNSSLEKFENNLY